MMGRRKLQIDSGLSFITYHSGISHYEPKVYRRYCCFFRILYRRVSDGSNDRKSKIPRRSADKHIDYRTAIGQYQSQ